MFCNQNNSKDCTFSILCESSSELNIFLCEQNSQIVNKYLTLVRVIPVPGPSSFINFKEMFYLFYLYERKH